MPKITFHSVLQWLVAAITTACFVVGLWSCEDPSGVKKGNTVPYTKIANIPANDTFKVYLRLGALPEATLFWSGGDPDGIVIAYQYRWTDSTEGSRGITVPWTTILNINSLGGYSLQNQILVPGNPSSLFRIYSFLATLNPQETGVIALIREIGDSLATRRAFAVPYKTGPVPGDSIYGGNPDVNHSPTKGTFIFGSPDTANVHKFEVRAIDNSDVQDPNPAYVFFWTLQSPQPTVLFASQPPPTGTQYVLRHLTERFTGLRFTFTTLDPSTFEQQYSWCVDDTVDRRNNNRPRWSAWSSDALAIVTGSSFLDTTADVSVIHPMFLRARNKWGVISLPIRTTFVSILPSIDDPTYPRKILIINNDKNGSGTLRDPDTTRVNDFYRGLMNSLGKGDRTTIWTRASAGYNFPPLTVLTKFSTVLFLYEQVYLPFPSPDRARIFSVVNQDSLRAYLIMGGKLIVSSPPSIETNFANYLDGLPPRQPWSYEIFHVTNTYNNPERDFAGVRGALGYPTMRLDSLKVTADSSYAIRNIRVNPPRGFAQAISLFDSRSDNPTYENRPVGVRYLAPPPVPPARQTYSVVFFGFPLYYAERVAVEAALSQAFIDINE
jgi:hypothetical protein